MSCKICGEEKTVWKGRYWFPDDGFVWGGLCNFCTYDMRTHGPCVGDFAVALYAETHGLTEEDAVKALKGGGPSIEEVDDYIDAMMG